MPSAIRVHQTGEPDVLRWEEGALPAPGPDEARVRHRFVGLNFIDVYQRRGLYKVALPFTPGSEGAGVVEDVGANVTNVRVGDRVAYCTGPLGAYAEARNIPAGHLVALPDDVDERTAAAMMLKGLTAQYLLRQTTSVGAGDTVLIHAAAGGVGLIASQWARQLGATVIGTVGSPEKAALAREHGCAHVIDYRREDFVARVKEITGGRGVRVVYDSVGKDTFAGSLDCLRPRGLLVLFGQSSGAVPPFDPLQLSAKGSLFLTRPTIFHHADTPEHLRTMADDLFAVVRAGAVKIQAPQVFPLRDAAAAHRALEARSTVGSTVLEV